jgi:AraC-like DNA-binding protein
MSTVAMRPSSAALSPFVASLHYHEGATPDAMERILPGGRVHLMVNLYEDEFRTYHGPYSAAVVHRTHGAVLGGPASGATVIDTREQRCLVTVDFKLGGAAAFFRAPVSEAHNQLVELDELWGRDGRVLRERLLEARSPEAMLRILETVLLDHLAVRQEPDPAIPFAASAFERGLPVCEVTSRLGLLPKTFVRRFRKQVGLSPKRFARVRRLQRVLGSIHDSGPIDWCDVAARHAYADQSHFIHDFRDLTGLTPAAYRPRSAAEHNHVPVSCA